LVVPQKRVPQKTTNHGKGKGRGEVAQVASRTRNAIGLRDSYEILNVQGELASVKGIHPIRSGK
jgi:hypothetical protein